MQRNLKKLASQGVDVLVIGGGAHGATITCHVAKVGYRVALVEKNDFCSATSANSLKILHGGLRYLQHLNIKRMRHSIVARREMMQIAPHLVQPLSCVMPLYGYGLRGRQVMQTAMLLNDCISWDRNKGLSTEAHLPPGFTVPGKKCQEIVPGVRADNLRGAAVWHDALAVDTERLIMSYLFEAIDYGAQMVNYTEVTGVSKDGDGLYLVIFKDTFTKQVYTVKTRFVVNAAGPWINNLFSVSLSPEGLPKKWALALNIVVRKQLFGKYAVALEGNSAYEDKDAILKRGKRLYFFVPWRGHTMIGTDYQESSSRPDNLLVQPEDIQRMVLDINDIYPPAQLDFVDVSFYHAGLLPMLSTPTGGSDQVQMEKNSQIHEYDKAGLKGVFSIAGVKYTTAPHIACELVQILRKRFLPPGVVNTQHQNSEAQWIPQNQEVASLLLSRYGHRASRVASYLFERTENPTWIDKVDGLLEAEIAYLIHEEMVCKLADIVLRRTGLGTAECPARKILEKIAAVMAAILDWDEERQRCEVEEVLARYSPLILSPEL